jgi:hypothetical protein
MATKAFQYLLGLLMTKIFFFSRLLLISSMCPVSVMALLWKKPASPSPPPPRLNKIELRSAGFYPASDRFKKIYGNVGLSLQAEAARTLRDYQYLEIWENLEWIFMHGKGHPHSCGKTSIDILNISFGLKTIGAWISNRFYFYAGIGPDIGIVFVENETHCLGKKIKDHDSYVGIGVIGKTGMQVFMSPTLYLSAFADYLYLPVHMDNTIDVGGLKVGGGLGARF